MERTTISFSEKNKGWTSFHSFFPSLMCRLNNKFLSVKGGQLFEHHDSENPLRNNFYGEQKNSLITTIFNNQPQDDKIFKTLVYEGNKPWSAKLRTNYTESSLSKDEFEPKESRYFAYIRGTENEDDLHGGSVQGIGSIQSISGNTINYIVVPDSISIGDNLYQINNGEKELIGEIIGHTPTSITVGTIDNTPETDLFSFSKKNNRVEGSEIRGYFMEAELENTDTEKVELFAVNTNAVKSYI